MQIFTVDCFTDRPFAGNPAAVCVLGTTWPPTGWLQQVAAELNLPATAFVHPLLPVTQLRWFSPEKELELCGSGTLAAAYVLGQTGTGADTRSFMTRGGVLKTRLEPDGRIALDFPVDNPQPMACPPALTAALGVTPVAVSRGRFDLIAELDTAHTVRAVTPDLAAVAALDCRGVIVTATGHTEGDFVSRFFAPASGIDEDPVTGSAHCTLGPYWSSRLSKSALTGLQLSARGGRVEVRLRDARVDLVGSAVMVTRGELAIPAG